jgi:hypothetical protein
MAVNEALIKAVGRAYAPKFQKTELFSESSKQKLDTVLAARKAEKIARDQRISAIVSEVQNVDISVTPPEQINQQYEISGNIRNEVAALAAQRAKLPQNSPQAFAIDQIINQKKQMFGQVVANAKDFKELQEEYLKADGWNMSAGVNPNQRDILDAIFADKQYTIEYDENGAPTYKTEFGNIDQKQLSNYFLKDDEMALTVTNYADDVLASGEQGVKLEGARKDILYRKILNDINAGGQSRLKSLIYDDLVEGQSLGLSEGATAEDAAEAIVRNLMNVNNQGLTTYQNKQNKLNNEKEEKDNRSATEITRSEEAQLKIQKINEGLDLEKIEVSKKSFEKEIGKDTPGKKTESMKKLGNQITNLISTDGGGVVQKEDGTFMLRRQNNSGTVIRSVDITNAMIDYIYGNIGKDELSKKIGLAMDYTEERDYQSKTEKDVL